MSRADEIFIQNCRDILDNGVWDTDLQVRPHWEDGESAHTVKKFGIVNRYDLSQEFPILTIRRTFWKSAIDELLWIWQAKSNNVNELRTRALSHLQSLSYFLPLGMIGKMTIILAHIIEHHPTIGLDQGNTKVLALMFTHEFLQFGLSHTHAIHHINAIR